MSSFPILATARPCSLGGEVRHLIGALGLWPPATSRRTPGTRRSDPGRGRCGGSRRAGLPHRGPPRPEPRSKRNHPLRSPSGETPDPLARLFARELAYGLTDHLLEAPDPV